MCVRRLWATEFRAFCKQSSWATLNVRTFSFVSSPSAPIGDGGKAPSHQQHGTWHHPVQERRERHVLGACVPATRPVFATSLQEARDTRNALPRSIFRPRDSLGWGSAGALNLERRPCQRVQRAREHTGSSIFKWAKTGAATCDLPLRWRETGAGRAPR